MSCEKCGFCEAELPAVENIAVDARSRGNYQIATMLDQALERCGVLRENLQTNDREYLTDISRVVKKQSSCDACTNLLKDAKNIVETTKGRQSSEPTMRGMGFGSMFAAARGSSNALTPEHIEPELRSSSGFIRMLEASSKNASSEDAIQRALDEIEQDEAKYATAIERTIEGTIPRQMGFGAMLDAVRSTRTVEKPEPEMRGGWGFRAMLDGASRGNATGESVERDDVKPVPYGLAAQFEAMYPNKTRETLEERSHIRRGMGFKAMLDGAGKGTE